MIRGFLLETLDVLACARRGLGGPCCRFEPSCSGYAREALERLPLPRALALAAGRILRCHPFHPGGWDPVPS